MKPPIEVINACDVHDTPGLIKRVLHEDCSKGKDACLVIKRTDTGWVWKCHRCGEKGGVAADKHSPKGMMDYIKEVPDKYVTDYYYKTTFLPIDSVPLSPSAFRDKFPVPEKMIQWLLSNRITEKDYLHMDINYSPWYDRLVFPIRNTPLLNEAIPDYKTLGWIGRAVGIGDKKSPKWLARKYFPCAFHYHKYSNNDSVIVIVEDIISAYRVNKATGLSVIGLLGKNINQGLLIKIKSWAENFNGRVVMWLDRGALNDALAHWKRMMSVGIRCKYIYTELDPKAYDDAAIRDYLKEFML